MKMMIMLLFSLKPPSGNHSGRIWARALPGMFIYKENCSQISRICPPHAAVLHRHSSLLPYHFRFRHRALVASYIWVTVSRLALEHFPLECISPPVAICQKIRDISASSSRRARAFLFLSLCSLLRSLANAHHLMIRIPFT